MNNIDNKSSRTLMFIFALLIVFVPSSVATQSLGEKDGITIVYQFTVGTTDRVEMSELVPMHYHQGKSIFLKDTEKESVDFDSDDVQEMKINIRTGTIYKQTYFIDRETKSIIAQEPILDEVFNVEENIPQFEWLITGEQKVIAGHGCYEATTIFRGRSYSVWFTPDVALDVGPWKFSGLPGAILQVHDKEGRFNWYCKSISSLSAENKALIQAPENKNTYSFGEFQIMSRGKILDYLYKRIGTGLTITSSPDYSSSLERPIK